jgi:ligand-binding sensor domain-containing protein/two-component sensor histidine kinase
MSVQVNFNFTLKFVSRTLKVTYFFLFSLLLISSFTYSQNSQLQNFNTKEGLPQSQVYDIVQDSIGYLWLGTQGGGLARFDGDEFTVFNKKKGLQSNFVNTLLVSGEHLYIGTHAGLSVYSKGKFSNFESPRVNKVVSLDDIIYLATNKGVYQYQNDSLTPTNISAQINVRIVQDLIKIDDDYLVATPNGLWRVDKLNNTSEITKIDESNYTALYSQKGRIIGATANNGIKLVGNKQLYRYQKLIHDLYFVDNQYWLSTNSDGIIILDDQFRKIQQIDQNKGLAINQVRTIFKDHQENVWVGTSGGGLYKLTKNNFQHFDRNNGLRGNRIYAVHTTRNNELWMSNSERGVTKIDSLGITPIFEDNGFLNVKAKTISEDEEENIWVGTEGKGILIFRKEYYQADSLLQNDARFNGLDKKLFPHYFLTTDTLSVDNGLVSNNIRKIIFGNRSAWIATYSSGIVRIPFTGKIPTLSKKRIEFGTSQGIQDLFINDIEIDSNGNLWYVTRSGNLGTIEKNKPRSFYQILGKETSITTIEIRDNEVLLGTLGDGIWVLNRQSPREIKQLSGVKELNSQNIYQLIFDDENNLWAGTEKGVNKIVLDENNSISDVFYFDRSNGFLGIETCQNAVTKDKEGNIWFGTMNGLTKYTPTTSQTKTIKPKLYFENIEVAYQSIDTININQFAEVLQLNPTQNHLSFQFKSIDINHPKGIEYRWKLNRDFSPWSTKDDIDFPNLQSGTYELVVEARNIDWVVSDPISFQFFIDRPLLEKSWFRTVVYSGLGLIVLIIILLIIRRAKLKNRQKLEQLELENHLLSLEQKALQLQMNPHFIFNVLNGIKAMGSVGETDQMNATINTFATLLRSILNSSRKEEISLKEEISTLHNYLTLEQQMVAQPFDFEIIHQTNGIDPEEILIPPMLIQPFVENSVKHGFQHNTIKGKIDIRFVVEGEFLTCEIKDNGIGIEQSKLKKKSHHPSTALKVTKERIESLTQDHQLKIREENGTIVSFRLPLSTDY